jgi:hypothetical protein
VANVSSTMNAKIAGGVSIKPQLGKEGFSLRAALMREKAMRTRYIA